MLFTWFLSFWVEFRYEKMTVYILDVRYYFLGVVEGEDVNCTVGTLLLKKHFFSPWIKSFAIAPSMDLTDTFSRKSSCPFPLEDSMLVLGAFDLLLFLISFAIVAKPPRTQYTHNVMQQCFLSLQVASRRDRNSKYLGIAHMLIQAVHPCYLQYGDLYWFQFPEENKNTKCGVGKWITHGKNHVLVSKSHGNNGVPILTEESVHRSVKGKQRVYWSHHDSANNNFR